MYSSTLSLTSVLTGGGWSFTPREGWTTHCIGGGVVPPGSAWKGMENLAPTGIQSQGHPPIASRYTDYAILAHINRVKI
jgi:hypothetical protein